MVKLDLVIMLILSFKLLIYSSEKNEDIWFGFSLAYIMFTIIRVLITMDWGFI